MMTIGGGSAPGRRSRRARAALMRCEKFRRNSGLIEPQAEKLREILMRFGLDGGTQIGRADFLARHIVKNCLLYTSRCV